MLFKSGNDTSLLSGKPYGYVEQIEGSHVMVVEPSLRTLGGRYTLWIGGPSQTNCPLSQDDCPVFSNDARCFLCDETYIAFVDKNATSLTLSHSKIVSMDGRTLTRMSALESLDLSHNALTLLSENVLGYTPELRKLDLSHNQLTSIEERTFAQLTNLIDLDLSYNNLVAMHMRAFDKLDAMEEAHLSNNVLDCSWNSDGGLGCRPTTCGAGLIDSVYRCGLS